MIVETLSSDAEGFLSVQAGSFNRGRFRMGDKKLLPEFCVK
jgi:hypothetical protein